MKTTVNELEDNRVKLSIEVEAAEFEVEVDKAFKKIARDVQLPGFRKGKVPRKVLESRFGSGIARGQALEDSIPEYFMAALSDQEIDIISPPEYEITSGEEDGPLAFDAVVEVRPEVQIAGYQNLRVEIESPEPTDDEIEEQIASFRGQFAELADVERPAQDGDTVTMDITTTYEGEEVDGLTASDYSYPVGSGGLVAELDENLTGAKVGDILEFDAEHPADDEDGELSFRILVKQVQEQALPELDDELVSGASEFETVEDYRADVQTKIRESKMIAANNAWREKAAEQLGRLVDLDPPTPLVDTEVRNRVEDMAQRLAQSGIGLENFLAMTGQSVEELFDQQREPATESVRVDLALRSLAAAEGLEATDSDVDDEFTMLAEGSGIEAVELRERINTPNQLMMMRADISKRKAAEWLLDQVEVVDENGNPVDKDALIPESHDQDHAHDHGDEEE